MNLLIVIFVIVQVMVHAFTSRTLDDLPICAVLAACFATEIECPDATSALP